MNLYFYRELVGDHRNFKMKEDKVKRDEINMLELEKIMKEEPFVKLLIEFKNKEGKFQVCACIKGRNAKEVLKEYKLLKGVFN